MKRKTEVIIGIGLIIALTGFAAAATIFGTTSGTVHWDATDGPEITTTDVDVEESVPIRNGVVDLGHTEFHSDGETAATVGGWGSSYISLTNIDASNELTVVRSGSEVSVQGQVTSLDVRAAGFDTGPQDQVRVDVAGSTTVTLSTPSISTDYVSIVDADTDEILSTVNRTADEISVTLSQDRNLRFEERSVSITDPSPADGEQLSSGTIEPSIDLSHPGTDDGSVTVEFVNASDDTVFDTQTVGSDGRVSTTWEVPQLGSNSWYVRTTDGGIVTESATFEAITPHQLEIRDEQTTELLDNLSADVTVRFFEIGGDDESPVVTRQTSDGIINLEGLPTGTDLLVDADVEGYLSRSVVIRSIGRQQTLYLASNDTDVVSVSFDLTLRSDSFNAETSRVIVRKPIQGDNSTSYQTILGDTFGANNRVDALLERGERYRIVVENEQGTTRSFGSYLAEVDGDVIDLDIGEISIEPPDAGEYVLDAREINVDVQGEERDAVRIVYRDESGTTERLNVRIHEQHNPENEIYGPEDLFGDQIAETVVIPESQENVSTWVVNYSLERGVDDSPKTDTVLVGELGDVDWPLGTQLLQVLGLGAILLVAGLFGGDLSQIGAVVTVGVAWMLTAIGFLTIPIEFLVAAGVIAVLYLIGQGRDEGGAPI